MYSERVTEEAIDRIGKQYSCQLVRFPKGRIADISEHLKSLKKPDGSFKRAMTKEESVFVRNERLVCQQDFRYWAENYCTIELDAAVGGGIGKLELWESQEILMRRIAAREEEGVDAWARGETADGILIVDHKDRQLGHTMFARGLVIHRVTLVPHTRGMSASVDADKVQELYDRDKTIIDNLPWYLAPNIGFDVKGEHLSFEKLGSRLLYQQGNAQTGLGQGRQFDIAHITEVASFAVPEKLEHDFFPALPQNPYTLCILESTAQGRGNYWHDLTERVRRKELVRWIYCFVPYYAEPKKYRRTPPPEWSPAEITMLHAKKVYDTSKEFVGKDVLLSRETLYWYETTRAEYQKGGKLNMFLTNYGATPEESFQHTTVSAFPPEVLERLRLHTSSPRPFDFRIGTGARPNA